MRYADWGRYIDMFDCGGSNCPVNVTYPVHTVSDLSRNFGYSCPSAEAKKLAEWTTPATFVTYVNSLAASGNTYHDIGLIWGARFLSPTGMFRTDNTNLRNIQRHMIFMTDGDTNVIDDDYSAYGIHWWDRRQTTYMPNNTQLNNILNARMAALCDAIKNQNITLWVISYGTDVTGATADRLRNCASEDRDVHYMVATDTESLMTQFQQIASKISDLRLTN
jgi:hypothetical protein